MTYNEKIINNKIAEFCRLASPMSLDIDDDNSPVFPVGLPTLAEMHVTDVKYDIPTNTYTITLCKPGILIGKSGKTIKAFENLLNATIVVVEKKFYKTIID